MTRPFRLFAILASALALAATATAQLVRAEGRPAQASATAVARTATGAAPGAAPAVTAAVQATQLDEALARAANAARTTGAALGSDYPLRNAPICSWALLNLKDKYVDPARFQPREMLVAALEGVEKRVAEVMVQGDAKSPRLSLTVGAAQKELDISNVQALWDIQGKLGEAFAFIQTHLVSKQDPREIEYAAVNGMLSTLDPHTQFLEPRIAKDMRIQTKGEFGGLGFVITMRDGNLTVVKVLKNTPAQRAGIKPKDLITRIEEQSTVNMDLQDAVDRLRGPPRTKVGITVQKPGAEPRKLRVTREMITVETVAQAQLLQGDVGYVRLSQFNGYTFRDLKQAINAEKARAGVRLSGLILDLRGNPGGLLDQAIQVSDLFLSEGVIVKTVGQGDAERIHDEKRASADEDDILNLPLVVIVNQNSASASEIVAGALKNNNRALVIGRQTFGKGSVQILNDYTEGMRPGEDPASLKMTIAQYLTPGDISIQETGITPDVLLLPGRALKEQVNYFAPPRTMGEVDLDRHLSNPGDATAKTADAPKRRTEKSALELRYLLDEKEDVVAKQLKKEAELELSPEQQEDEDSDADPDEFVEDYQIRFAADLIRRAPTAFDRARLLEAAKALVSERSTDETARVEKRLKELGVDWSTAATTGAPRGVVTLSPPVGRDLRAGDTVPWTVTVENRGDAPFHRLRGWTSSDKNALLDRREFLFGTIRPGEKRAWTVPLKLPRALYTGRDEVVFHFDDDGGHAPPDFTTSVGVVEVPKPIFAFSVQVDDRQGGNGDGLPQRGETFTLRVDVKNAGPGASGEKTVVTLKNLGDEKLFITKGRDVVGALKPGEVRSAAMEVELKRGSTSETLPIRVTVSDDKTFEQVSEELDIPLPKGDGAPLAAAGGAVRITAPEALLRAGASPTAPVLATAKAGAVLPVLARTSDFYCVEWKKGRMAFAAAADVAAAKTARLSGAVAEAWQREPPRITLNPDPTKGAPVVDSDTWHLSGSAMVPPSADPSSRLRDLFVMVNDQKIFFKVQPENSKATRMDFATDVPLKPGINVVAVFAREDEEFQSRRVVAVYRRPPATVAADGSKAEQEKAQ